MNVKRNLSLKVNITNGRNKDRNIQSAKPFNLAKQFVKEIFGLDYTT